jgi:hypothetical protein
MSTATATATEPQNRGYEILKRLMASGTATMSADQIAEKVRSMLAPVGDLDIYHNSQLDAAEKLATYKSIITALAAPASGDPKTPQGDANSLFRDLATLLKRGGPAIAKRVAAHVREVTNYNLLPQYHGDKSVPDNEKVALYTELITALKTGNLDSLKGVVGKGEAQPAPQAEPEPEPSRIDPVETSQRYASQMPPDLDEEDEAAVIARILARRKPKIDEADVRRIVDEAIGVAVDSVANRIPGKDEIKKVITEAMANGAFPEDRVSSIVEDRLKKVAPNWDLDSIVKPKVDELLALKLQDFLKRGGAALATGGSPKLVNNRALASYVPLPDPTYIVSYKDRAFLDHIYYLSRQAPINVLATGPHGCGKTSMAEFLGSRFNMPVLVMDCANIREPRDWFGYKYTDAGSVLWHRSQFDRCLEAGNHVIVLDELPRTTDQIRNTLFPLLDYRRRTYLEERGDYITVGPGTIFFVTANIGLAYTGCSELDLALDDRLTRRLEVNYLSVADEAKVLVKRTGIDKDNARRLAEMAEVLRTKAIGFGASLTKTVSTRQLIEAAKDFMALGVEGLTYTITHHYSAEGGDQSERAQVLQTIQGKFPSSGI